ncbi:MULTISPECIES: type I-G CRISPR-associated protein Csb2 [Actinomyces]|uniref:type I-G CRISPR-associated protein Csb2 n=1 Tax=Actinomyces TaxID=1654 RepID=UPI00135C5B93|nr:MULTISPECIES: type I-U CRISPR-associated protein Csb2 [Actinomyces]
MGSIALTARFPLSAYHGHGADGSPDHLPSPARLFSALVSAAWTSSADGSPTRAAGNALEWLEGNPPTGLRLPPSMSMTDPSIRRIAYRDTGTLKKHSAKKAGKEISEGIVFDGEIAWIWESIPPEVHDALRELCADVPHLGEADSPVILEIVNDVRPTWCLNPQATAFTAGGLRLPIAVPGRAEALARAHEAAYPSKSPTSKDDKYKETESVVTFPSPLDCLATAHYEPVGQEASAGEPLPWGDVVIFLADDGSGQEIEPSRRVGWCVGLHKAIISRIGDGAPAMVTGHYPEGRAVPANRLAIHYLSASVLAQSLIGGIDAPGAFLIMLPRDVDPSEAGVILGALAGLRWVRSRWGVARVQPLDETHSAASFWKEPAPGTARLWSPTPAAVPEVVRQRGEWSFENAILLSLGFVWRDQLKSVGRGPQGYRDLVSQVRERRASVMWYQRVARRPSAYSHKMPQGMTAQPYRALIDAGDLLPDRALMAVGQSRHLGGGLLAPADLPAELVRDMSRRNDAEH